MPGEPIVAGMILVTVGGSHSRVSVRGEALRRVRATAYATDANTVDVWSRVHEVDEVFPGIRDMGPVV